MLKAEKRISICLASVLIIIVVPIFGLVDLFAEITDEERDSENSVQIEKVEQGGLFGDQG